MRSAAALLSVLFIDSGCASTAPRQPRVASEKSPCNDSLYVALKGEDLSEMTQREYEYFQRKDAACDRFRTGGPGSASKEEVEATAGRAVGAAVVTSVLAVAAGVILLLTI